MDREQLDRGYAQVDQVSDRGLVAEPGVGPPQLGGNTRVGHGEALHMHLVDDRVGIAVVAVGAGRSRRTRGRRPGCGARGRRSPARWRCRCRRRRSRGPRDRTAPCPWWPGRRDRSVVWPGCSAAPGPDRRDRWRDNRRPARARPRARNRATPRRRSPAGGSGSRSRRRRRGTTPFPRRP